MTDREADELVTGAALRGHRRVDRKTMAGRPLGVAAAFGERDDLSVAEPRAVVTSCDAAPRQRSTQRDGIDDVQHASTVPVAIVLSSAQAYA